MRSLLLFVTLATVGACGPGATTEVRAPVTNQPPVEARPARPRLTLDGALAMMPEDTEMVFELDVARLRQSVLWERIEPWLRAQGGETLAEVTRLCAFDPIASLDTVLVGAKGIGMGQLDATLFVRGFDQRASTRCLELASAAARERGETKSLVVDGDYLELREGTAASLGLTFVDEHTALLLSHGGNMVDRATLAEAAARRAGEGLTRSAPFKALLARVDTRATTWLAMNGRSPIFASMPYAVRAVRLELHTGADPARALVGALVIEVGDAANAQSLAQMFTMAIDTLKGGPYDDLTRALTVTDEGGDVVVDLRLDLAQLERLAGFLGPVIP
ncbi:MAG TPA: hypothetical protein VM261_30380 [Kofleriaceae bacterium]|nr:hypothetical protein [Kofleriaceae bacterium]